MCLGRGRDCYYSVECSPRLCTTGDSVSQWSLMTFLVTYFLTLFVCYFRKYRVLRPLPRRSLLPRGLLPAHGLPRRHIRRDSRPPHGTVQRPLRRRPLRALRAVGPLRAQCSGLSRLIDISLLPATA